MPTDAGHVGGCGVTDEVAAWMDEIQHGAAEEDDRAGKTDPKRKESGFDGGRADGSTKSGKLKETSSWYKYSHEANAVHGHEQRKRAKRSATLTSSRSTTRTTCSLFIQTDPLLWRHFYEAEKHNAEHTRKEITSLIAQHVKAVNAIYMDTKFDGKYPHRMTRFEVQRIKIDDDKPCQPNYPGEENKFCLPNIDVSNFLNLHSQGNHEDFCLAYVFTYR